MSNVFLNKKNPIMYKITKNMPAVFDVASQQRNSLSSIYTFSVAYSPLRLKPKSR